MFLGIRPYHQHQFILELHKLISKHKQLEEQTVKVIEPQLLSAVKYLHDNMVMTDFGLTKMVVDPGNTFLCTFHGALNQITHSCSVRAESSPGVTCKEQAYDLVSYHNELTLGSASVIIHNRAVV